MATESDVVSDLVTNATTDAVLGGSLPAPIRKNLFKAIGRLCTAAIDYPVACLEGKAEERRSETQARISLIQESAQQISEKMNVDSEFVRVASEKYSQRVIQEQINLNEISKVAIRELENNNSSPETTEEISDDWLSSFEREASTKSSEEMKLLFGKVLANEINKPASFSIRTIKILSQLDNEAAQLFVTFCSSSISLRVKDYIVDGRVVAFSGNATQNSLLKYGLSFNSLNILFEYGLLVSDYNCYCSYDATIAKNGKVSATLYYQNKHYGLLSINDNNPIEDLRLHGVALSKAGKELLSIVDIEENDLYLNDLTTYFESKNVKLIEVKI